MSKGKVKSITPEMAGDSAGSLERMVLRWTPEQRERAWAIVNDIAEDIDNGESRKELRQALAIYADHLRDALQAKADERSVKIMEAIGKLDALLLYIPGKP